MNAQERARQWEMHTAVLRNALLATADREDAPPEAREAIVSGVGMLYVLGDGLLALMAAAEAAAERANLDNSVILAKPGSWPPK